MSEEQILEELIEVCGTRNISKEPKLLEEYSKDLSFFPKKVPKYVIWPKNRKQVQKVLKLANNLKFSIYC